MVAHEDLGFSCLVLGGVRRRGGRQEGERGGAEAGCEDEPASARVSRVRDEDLFCRGAGHGRGICPCRNTGHGWGCFPPEEQGMDGDVSLWKNRAWVGTAQGGPFCLPHSPPGSAAPALCPSQTWVCAGGGFGSLTHFNPKPNGGQTHTTHVSSLWV